MKFWPYRILRRNDEGVKADLTRIMEHFTTNGLHFDLIVFIPNAGRYLNELFTATFGNSYKTTFVTVRRASTVAQCNFIKDYVFRHEWLSNIMRHVEVFVRLVKYRLGIKQKMTVQPEVDFDVANKRLLVIDDSVDTGTTLKMVKSALIEGGAESVAVACISNHLLPHKVSVDYAVYKYALLRTKNSRDYNAV